MEQRHSPGHGSGHSPGEPATPDADEQFAQLARPHLPALLHLAAALVGFADAEDAAQEALLRGLQAWPTLRDPVALRGWLLRIAYHVCLDWRRGHFGTTRRLTQPLAETTVAQLPILPDGPGTSEHAARMDLRSAINTLSVDLRQVVTLRYYVGLDASEIGTLLGLPPSTVRSHLRRARDQLRERLHLPDEPTVGRDEKGGR